MLVATMCVLVILIAAYVFALRSFDRGLCANELIASDTAPSRRYKAIVFVRNCGATTTFGTHVSIVDRDARLGNDEIGNVLAIDATCCRDPRSRELPRNSVGGPLAITRWIGSDTLAVTYARGVRIFQQSVVYDGVYIAYAQID